jgi:hypothetical protein
MGIAAYNRGSALISRQLGPSPSQRELAKMRQVRDRLNALPKLKTNTHVNEDLRFSYDAQRDVWWVSPARCVESDYAEMYPTLKDAIQAWPHFLIYSQEDERGWYWLGVLPS